MKALFIGGVKSGKSFNAEQYTLALNPTEKPLYLVMSEAFDDELKKRVELHKQKRGDHFVTIEEPLSLVGEIESHSSVVLVECVTLWINNMLHYGHSQAEIIEHIEAVLALPNDLVFVHNDVGTGIMPDNKFARQYIDISGIVAQKIAIQCDEVYHCIAGGLRN